MKRRVARGANEAEQLGIGFEGIEVIEPAAHEPAPDTMRQIVSLRMPDALLERVEEAAAARGVSPSSLMRALIAAGLDRSYAAVREPSDLATEIADARRAVDALARAVEAGAGGRGLMEREIGFAFNPYNDRAPAVLDRGHAWCQAHGVDAWDARATAVT